MLNSQPLSISDELRLFDIERKCKHIRQLPSNFNRELSRYLLKLFTKPGKSYIVKNHDTFEVLAKAYYLPINS